jgi:hypothetical protein
MSGFTLTVEDRPKVESPSLSDIVAAITSMTLFGGPGFAVIDGPNYDYAQAAGGEGEFTAEWRENFGEGYRHWRAGRPGVSNCKETVVQTNGYVVRVRSNEVLGESDVIAILTAFASGIGRPNTYTWREISSELPQ